ncbi:hypothetical protein [Pseudoscardovia radai]|uniref:hypothetical protein n=1 Tax=Pseudoscardovia radai TaxID=987066 RepID=UPI0039926830
MTFLASARRGTSGARSSTPTLTSRRRGILLRRIACAACAGLLAWCIVSAIGASNKTRLIAVAARDIAVGETVPASALATAWVAQDDVSSHAYPGEDVQSWTPGVAQIDIGRGMPIIRGMVSGSVRVAQGMTTVDVTLASTTRQLRVGDTVTLMVSGACPSMAGAGGSTGTGDGADIGNATDAGGSTGIGDATHCVLARGVTVMHVPDEEDSTSILGEPTGTATFALTPGDALTVLSVGDDRPIIAVSEGTPPVTGGAGDPTGTGDSANTGEPANTNNPPDTNNPSDTSDPSWGVGPKEGSS